MVCGGIILTLHSSIFLVQGVVTFELFVHVLVRERYRDNNTCQV